ncbi:MAG: HD domain-containing protein, partial [Saprospiraceae bacterium]
MSSLLSSKAEKKAKKAVDYPSIFGSVNLISIRDNVGEILKLIGRDGIFREYTLHDANHIDAMLALVDKLIPDDTAAQMKTADWLMIVLSCYFHDLGMLVTKDEFKNRNDCPEFISFKTELLAEDKGKDYEEALEKLTPEEREEFLYQEFVRKNHAKRISYWIQGQNAPQYGEAEDAVAEVNGLLSGLEQVVRDDLAKICLSHHEDDLYDLDKYQVNRVYGDDPEGEANLHYAALMLRTADVLQIQKKRVPAVLYKLIDPSNPKSQEEWAKQAGVRSVKPKKTPDGKETDTIEVHASFDEERAYFGLLAYLQQYAGKELERCYEWARQAQQNKGVTFRFPWKQIDSSQVEPRGFEGRSYSFKLDQERILKLLTGHTLYNDSRVAIREVLQNALDAVRFRH